MRVALAIGTLLAAAAIAPASASAATPKPKRTCYPAHSTTLAATKSVRVFQTRALSRDTKTHATYGCLLSSKHPYRFEVLDFPFGFAHIAIAGRFVAYADYSDCAADFCDPNSVVVDDLRTRRRTFADGPAVRVARVSDLVLRSDGAAAWIQTTYDEHGSVLPGFEVVTGGPGHPAVVLDSGTDIVAGSLALAGTTVYWTKGTTPASAQLS